MSAHRKAFTGDKTVISGRALAMILLKRLALPRRPLNLNSEVAQVVLVLLLVLVLENSRSLAVTLLERNSVGLFVPCFDGESQPIEHDDEHEFPNFGI